MAYTYTVSRAFHLMRNSGAIMQSIYNSYRILNNVLMEYDKGNWVPAKLMFADELMDSWIEVTDPATELPRQALY